MELLLKNSINTIDLLEKSIKNTWEQLIKCEVNDAMNGLVDIFNNIDKLLINIENLKKDTNLKIDTSNVLIVFSTLEVAMKDNDYTYISDLLRYELKPILLQWKKILNNFLDDNHENILYN